MSEVGTAAPAAEVQAPVEASDQDKQALAELTEKNRAIDQAEDGADPAAAGEKKTEKTPEQREIERLRRGIDRRTRQLAEARAMAGLTRPHQPAQNTPQDDGEKLSLSRAEAQRMIEEEALKRAPEIAKRQAEEQHLRNSAVALQKTLGDEFEELTDALADVFSAPRQLDVLGAENPAALLRYLTDPEHVDEAKAIADMSHFQAGRAIARIEAKLKAAEAKPKLSKAPAPLEAVRGSGPTTKTLADMSYQEFVEARRKQIKARR